MPNQPSKIFYLVTLGLLFLPQLASAAGFLDSVGCIKSKGGCASLSDVTLAMTAFIKYALGIIGGVALLFFIWGGVQWLISGGNSERIQRGKQIMINTSLALVVAFGSYVLLSFFINNILNVKTEYQVASECLTKGPGESCNLGLQSSGQTGNVYVCSGNSFTGDQAQYNQLCLTKCELKSLQDASNKWACGSLSQLISSGGSARENVDFVKGLCPGGEDNVCIAVSAYLNNL